MPFFIVEIGRALFTAMAAAPVADGKDNDAGRKARNVVVKSEIVDVANDDYSVPQDAIPAGANPAVTIQFPRGGDSTECSSSFDASYSVSDDDVESDTGTMEVNSMLQSDINIDDSTAVPHLVR
ncbi:hypothetical protein PR202_ga04436 [Eleusine coracana subsp. coracana]|uniref:Uncharacterized protein n=1 Tax=Eleusine coracana subsp. coracana TaxID=191504 RepID=A0AAV5BPN6_ELECO|nr:hypothetical protein PR202_ga04436 [Eleusine coracana subsp. coracana]